ncbi:GumC family protein [Pontibacter silvestris]|uniref:GumC family protein n=1 Tax=Pontibacter silvestris TaxID=2305183 RepID=A0ABW4WYT4_9BACT|nr:hypothetical protein [Pontibacter silvestris]MCC9138831.1 hypothetical protein [Pontibacter silvestris]
MTLKEFKRLMLRNRWLLILIPVVTAVSVYFFTSLQQDKYTSKTTIFTGIASGYRIAGDNNEGFRIGAENAFGNFNSLIEARDTKEEVIFNLLATHLMLPKSDPKILDKENYDRLKELLPAALRKKLVAGTVEKTAANIEAYFKSSNKNEIHKLLNSNDPVYSYNALSNVQTSRVGASEMVELEYTSNDPAVSQHTLEFLLVVFTRKHKDLFAGQTESVISFFDSAKQNAYERLKEAEQKLLDFNKANHIVDYEGQIATTSAEKAALADRAYNLEMEYAGAFANLKTVEESLKKRGVANMHNQEIGRIRNQLAKVTSDIAEAESVAKNGSDASASSKLARLRQQEKNLTDQLKETINKYYADTHTTSGASTDGLLDEWVRNSILVEQIKSQLNLMHKQQEAFAGEYDKLVPLGAEVRKIRREIEVAEQEYMFQMQGLKQSMLTQQNIELASQLKVIDQPNLPSSSSTDLMIPILVLFGAVGAFFMTTTGIVAADLLDTSLKTPAFVSKITNFPVIGVLLGTRKGKYSRLADRAEEQLAKQLLLRYHQKESIKGPFLVGVLSSHAGEGKSTVSNVLATHLQSFGIDTLVLYPENNHLDALEVTPNATLYSPLSGVTPNVSVAELSGKNMLNYSIVLVEFPAVLDNAYPVSLLKDLDLTILTVKANRKWQQADRNVFASIKGLTDSSIEVVLNGAAPEDVEEFIGAGSNKQKGDNVAERDNTKVLTPEPVDQNHWEGEAAVLNS